MFVVVVGIRLQVHEANWMGGSSQSVNVRPRWHSFLHLGILESP